MVLLVFQPIFAVAELINYKLVTQRPFLGQEESDCVHIWWDTQSENRKDVNATTLSSGLSFLQGTGYA